MEFKQILSQLELCEKFCGLFTSGELTSEEFTDKCSSTIQAFEDTGPRLSKCVARAREPDPEKRIYGAAQTERVLAAEARYQALTESMDRVVKAADALREAQEAKEVAARATASTLKEIAAATAILAEEARLQAEREARTREEEISSALEKERLSAVSRVSAEVQARAASRASDREREAAQAAAKKAEAERAAEHALKASLEQERNQRTQRLNAMVAEADKNLPGEVGVGSQLQGGVKSITSSLTLKSLLREMTGVSANPLIALFHESWQGAMSKAAVAHCLSLASTFPKARFIKIDLDTAAECAVEEGVLETPVFKVWGVGLGGGELVSLTEVESYLRRHFQTT